MDEHGIREHASYSFIRPKLPVPNKDALDIEKAAAFSQVCSCGKGLIEMYCKLDNALVCLPCYFRQHKRCETLPVKQLAEGVMESRELETLIRDMEVLRATFIRVLGDRKQQTVYRGQRMMGVYKSLIHGTKRLNIWKGFEKLEKEVVAKAVVCQAGMQINKVISRQKCRKAVREIGYHLTMFSYFRQQGNETGMCIEMLKSREAVARCMDILNSVSEVCKEDNTDTDVMNTVADYYTLDNLGNVKFCCSPGKGKTPRSLRLHKSSSLSSASADNLTGRELHLPVLRACSERMVDRTKLRMGILSARSLPPLTSMPSVTSLPSLTSSVEASSVKNKLPTVKYALQRFNMRTADDAFENNVSAMAFLKDERILILDSRNNKLKLFSRYRKYLCSLDMLQSIWDMTLTNENEALITCPSDGRLQHVQISRDNALFPTGHIATMKECRAICSVRDWLYVSFSGPNPCIRILSGEGIMYRTILSTNANIKLMQNPLHMLVKSDGRLIYISDYTLQTVFVIDHRGSLVHSHDMRPGWPLGMTTDKDDNVIVCVSGTGNIRMIMKDNSRSEALVSSHIFHGDPCSVSFQNDHDLLYVACEKQSELKLLYLI